MKKCHSIKRLFALLLGVIMGGGWYLPALALEVPQLHVQVRETAKAYGDTVGWVQVPGTGIDEAVMHKADDITYYLRRDHQGKYDFEGSYFADYRCDFSEDSQTSNIVIYGNSASDDADGSRFGQLKRYKGEDFLKQNPYIFFATKDKTFVYEVFAVSIMDVSVPYNNPNPDEKEFIELVKQARASSLHKLDSIAVGNADKLLTLSTPDYSAGPVPGNARFVVMARLVEESVLAQVEQPVSPEKSANPKTGR